MKCSMCSVEVQPGTKVLVVTKGERDSFVLRWSCEHYPVDESDHQIVAILGAMHCATLWFGEYMRKVHDCSGHRL